MAIEIRIYETCLYNCAVDASQIKSDSLLLTGGLKTYVSASFHMDTTTITLMYKFQ